MRMCWDCPYGTRLQVRFDTWWRLMYQQNCGWCWRRLSVWTRQHGLTARVAMDCVMTECLMKFARCMSLSLESLLVARCCDTLGTHCRFAWMYSQRKCDLLWSIWSTGTSRWWDPTSCVQWCYEIAALRYWMFAIADWAGLLAPRCGCWLLLFGMVYWGSRSDQWLTWIGSTLILWPCATVAVSGQVIPFWGQEWGKMCVWSSGISERLNDVNPKLRLALCRWN